MVFSVSFHRFSKREFIYQETTFFEEALIGSLGVIQNSFAESELWLEKSLDHYMLNVNASRHNEDLQRRIEKLEADILGREEIVRENKRLKKLLKFGAKTPYQKVLAQVVAWDASSDFRVVRINKGSNDGIRIQAPVVTAQGVVGYIYRLTKHFADILTVLDSNNRVDALAARVRAHGIVEGYSNNRVLMKYVTRMEPVTIDDLVLTSGLGNIYPKGLVIGRIDRIERQSYGITQHIEIRPAVDFSRLEEVIVLVSAASQSKKKEYEALDAIDGRE